MNLIETTRQFATDDQCLDYLEAARWPNGVCCVHCGVLNVSTITRKAGKKNKRTRIYQCLEEECGKQFSATSGTIFNDTHLPLTKWFMAIAMICEAKKGMSAKQLERHLGVNYRTAWHLCHRIRGAMQDGGDFLTGVVEADETYLTPKKPRKGKPYVKKEKRDIVLGMIERGGRLRLIPIADAKREIIEPVLDAHISPDATLQTDGHATYGIISERKWVGKHRVIDHNKSYAWGDVHTNTIENAFSLLKRGIYGTFHKVSIKHLGRYCNEFSYRFNRRESQLEMFGMTVKNLVRGEVLPYKKLTAKVSGS
jgi:transposase-like protein